MSFTLLLASLCVIHSCYFDCLRLGALHIIYFIIFCLSILTFLFSCRMLEIISVEELMEAWMKGQIETMKKMMLRILAMIRFMC